MFPSHPSVFPSDFSVFSLISGFSPIPFLSPSFWCFLSLFLLFSTSFWGVFALSQYFSSHSGVFPAHFGILGLVLLLFHFFFHFGIFPRIPVIAKSWCFSASLSWGFTSCQRFSPNPGGFLPHFGVLPPLTSDFPPNFRISDLIPLVFCLTFGVFPPRFSLYILNLVFSSALEYTSPHLVFPPHFGIFPLIFMFSTSFWYFPLILRFHLITVFSCLIVLFFPAHLTFFPSSWYVFPHPIIFPHHPRCFSTSSP